MFSCRMFLRALDTKPLFGRLANALLTPLGCIKGHLTYFKLSNLNTLYDRAQQFSSCKTITISGQKVKINIMKWVSLSFISIAVNPNITASLRIYMKTCGFLVIARLCKSQFSKNESKTQPPSRRRSRSAQMSAALCPGGQRVQAASEQQGS